MDIEIEQSQAKLLHKNSKSGDLCSQALNQADSSTIWSSIASHKPFLKDTRLDNATEHTETDSRKYPINRWQSRLQLIWPDIHSHRIKEPLLLTSLGRTSVRNITETITGQCKFKDFQYRIWKSSALLCMNYQEESHAYFLFECLFTET